MEAGSRAEPAPGSEAERGTGPQAERGTGSEVESRPAGLVSEALGRRTAANRRFFEDGAERIARLCHRMAERFARGGRLLALGASPAARSDARHVAVEFVHPVIVGKRALPALALTPEGGPLRLQAELIARPEDIAIVFEDPGGSAWDAGDAGDAGTSVEDAGGSPGGGAGVRDAGAAADALPHLRDRGCLTIAFSPVGAEWEFPPPVADPFIAQELGETLYHVLWELVHVFFEHRGLLEGRRVGRAHDAGDASFLYPFLGEEESNLEAVVEDVRASVLMKAEEVGELRERTVEEGRATLLEAAGALRRAFDEGRTLLALGNGGSATDAMDVVADFRAAPARPPGAGGGPRGRSWPARPALDLTEDTGILTAVSNDVGTDAIFSRQVIAYGAEGDVVLALSTSGSSRNVVRALEEARRRGLRTVALVGYDGGRIGADGLADQVIVAPSEHIPRIQEAHATIYHLLRELVEVGSGARA